MSKASCRKFTLAFESKVYLEAIKEEQTIDALSKNIICALSKVVKITFTNEAGYYPALVAPTPFRAMSLS